MVTSPSSNLSIQAHTSDARTTVEIGEVVLLLPGESAALRSGFAVATVTVLNHYLHHYLTNPDISGGFPPTATHCRKSAAFGVPAWTQACICAQSALNAVQRELTQPHAPAAILPHLLKLACAAFSAVALYRGYDGLGEKQDISGQTHIDAPKALVAEGVVDVGYVVIALHNLKNQDYGTTGDPLQNVRASEEFGIPAWVGALVRMNDKVSRIKSFCQKGSLANESLDDSLQDLATYAVIAVALYLDTVADCNQTTTGGVTTLKPTNY